MEKAFIFYADRIVSVRNPYMADTFVMSHSCEIEKEKVSTYLSKYYEICSDNSLLRGILGFIHECAPNKSVEIVDIGVFMASFSNAASIVCRQLGIESSINAYEVNPRLISPILENLDIYQSEVFLHWCGIGKEDGSMQLSVNMSSAIGGSLAFPQSRDLGNSVTCKVAVRSLSSIIGEVAGPAPGLVKIDIEGYEVPAFSSIIGEPSRLNNIFIVEYNPYQFSQNVAGDYRYSEFLLDNFHVYNIGNWGWVKNLEHVGTLSDLSSIYLGNGGKNTDILLLPKTVPMSIEQIMDRRG